MRLRIALALILIMEIPGVLFSQTPGSPESNLCEPPVENCMGDECERGKPVVFGKPYLAPKLKVRLLEKYTNKPVAGSRITVSYYWKWFEYPYRKVPFGTWSEENYSTTCYANEDGVIEVGEFKVEPHGWYKGIYSVGKKPKFLHVMVGYQLPYVGTNETGCYTYTDITIAELNKCKRSGKCEFTIRDACPLDWKPRPATRQPNNSSNPTPQ